ncbi:hypothetical protein T12_10069 [Trichinella patagoniensis]|uniref:Uncharacterized protein n=1 Tax=Trichinella patagoniensis TaxID=990121 RepID=A0A0V1AGJ4_9BILA|nr:hypothetical protein T12_10069 [Trichinella patagoniensis]
MVEYPTDFTWNGNDALVALTLSSLRMWYAKVMILFLVDPLYLVLFWLNAKILAAVVFHIFLEMVTEFSCHLARSYLPLVLRSCLSYIFLIYLIFSQTDQSLSFISWLRGFSLIVTEMSLTESVLVNKSKCHLRTLKIKDHFHVHNR